MTFKERLRAWGEVIPANLAVFILCLMWILPTLGLLITSFRPQQAVNETGWWTVVNTTQPGKNEFAQSCAGCHGDDGSAISTAN